MSWDFPSTPLAPPLNVHAQIYPGSIRRALRAKSVASRSCPTNLGQSPLRSIVPHSHLDNRFPIIVRIINVTRERISDTYKIGRGMISRIPCPTYMARGRSSTLGQDPLIGLFLGLGRYGKNPIRYVLRYAQSNTQYVLTIRYKGKHLGTLRI